MSGGEYGFLYIDVEDIAARLANDDDPLRRAFSVHLYKVAEALHDVEWVDSGDYGDGEEKEAIQEVLGADTNVAELNQAVDAAFTQIEKAR